MSSVALKNTEHTKGEIEEKKYLRKDHSSREILK